MTCTHVCAWVHLYWLVCALRSRCDRMCVRLVGALHVLVTSGFFVALSIVWVALSMLRHTQVNTNGATHTREYKSFFTHTNHDISTQYSQAYIMNFCSPKGLMLQSNTRGLQTGNSPAHNRGYLDSRQPTYHYDHQKPQTQEMQDPTSDALPHRFIILAQHARYAEISTLTCVAILYNNPLSSVEQNLMMAD